MANCAGIPPGNEGEDVQLFNTEGSLVATVRAPPDVGVIMWQGVFFALREGRFVATKAFTSIEPFITSSEAMR